MEVAVLGGRWIALAARGALRRVDPGGQGREDRVKPRDGFVGAADHQAVAALEAEHTARGAAVDVVDPALRQLGGAADVIAVVGVAAVDHSVAGLEHVATAWTVLSVISPGRDHHPDRPWGASCAGQLRERGGGGGPFAGELFDRAGVDVVDDAPVAVAHQAPGDVRAHPAEADDAKLGTAHSGSFRSLAGPRPSYARG